MSDKANALKELDAGYQELRKAIEGLDAAALQKSWLDDWSVKDIIAHILGWQKELTGALQRIARGERPTPEGVDYSNTDRWNAKFALVMKQQLPTTVIAEWGQVHMVFTKVAQAVPEDRFAGKDGKPSTVMRILDASGFGHMREHAQQILDWRKRDGI
jgi:hypothetical protein